jgi:hypothetical protein
MATFLITFLIKLYYPKTCRSPDHSTRIAEHQKLLLSQPTLNPTPSPRLEPGTVFRDCGLYSCNISAETILFFRISSIVIIFRATENTFAGNRSQNNFSRLWPLSLLYALQNNQLCVSEVLLSCLVFELHKPSSS